MIRRDRPELLGLLLSFAFAILVCFVSNNLSPRFQHRAETIQQQFAILSGDPLLFDGQDLGLRERRGRVLFPIALTTLSRAEVLSVGQWYLVLTALTAFAAFVSFWFLIRKTVKGDVRLAAAGLFLLAYQLIFTFNVGWENTTDFPDVAFATLFLWAILSHRRWWLLGLVLLATLNREVSVFAGVVWLFVYGFGHGLSVRVKDVAFSVGLSVVAYLEALAVRSLVTRPAVGVTPSDPGYAGQLTHVIGFWNRVALDVVDVLRHPTLASWPFLWLAMLAPAIAWICLNRSGMRTVHRRLLMATACIFPISLAYGTPAEIREYLTPLVMLAYVAVALEGERARRAAARVDVLYQATHEPIQV